MDFLRRNQKEQSGSNGRGVSFKSVGVVIMLAALLTLFSLFYGWGLYVVASSKHEHRGTESYDSYVSLRMEDAIDMQARPKSLAIVLPFIVKDAPSIILSLRRWTQLGDPCPMSASLKTKPVDVILWFHRDLDAPELAEFRADFQEQVSKTLRPIRHCFEAIKFESAFLTPKEDVYPIGPTRQFYNLFSASARPLATYDFFFWHEHDVQPIRAGWVDALVIETTFRGDFFVKGSIHRGNKVDEAAMNPSQRDWINHINGNALYRSSDPTFVQMVLDVAEADADKPVTDFMASFDLALWLRYVASYDKNWQAYKNYAHKFQYSDIIQSHCDDLDADQLVELLENSPNTYFIHGASQSSGGMLRKYRPQSPISTSRISSPKHLAVAIVVRENQVAHLEALMKLSENVKTRACATKQGHSIDLIFYIDTEWDRGWVFGTHKTKIQSWLRQYRNFAACFSSVKFLESHIDRSHDQVESEVDMSNLLLMRLLQDPIVAQSTSYLLVLNPFVLPIRGDWLEAFRDHALGGLEDFWMKGSAYRGFRLEGPTRISTTSDAHVWDQWPALSTSGMYNIQAPELINFLELVRNQYPALPLMVGVAQILRDRKQYAATKDALAYVHYSNFIQNHGETRFSADGLRKTALDTYLVESECREEFGRLASQPACLICPVNEDWSETCLMKVKQGGRLLG